MLCHICIRGYYVKYPGSLCSAHRISPEDLELPGFVIEEFNASLREWHKDCYMAKFIARTVGIEEIHNAIDDWHMGKHKTVGVELYVYLGMSEPEYELFIKDEKAGIHSAAKRWMNRAGFKEEDKWEPV